MTGRGDSLFAESLLDEFSETVGVLAFVRDVCLSRLFFFVLGMLSFE
jgi:hypothetical protein